MASHVTPVLTTSRLRLREMQTDDLDQMAGLLGDPEVMEYYPGPKTRQEAAGWIGWNQHNYREHGFGLWIVETQTGDFVGDCGLTMQTVNGQPDVEVGYHVRSSFQGQGLATEAATACKDFAFAIGVTRLLAIIHPQNLPSQRVATKIGLSWEQSAVVHGRECWVYATTAKASKEKPSHP